MSGPTRPALRYLGGKWRLAPWIIGHFPPHRTYVEPYGGAASVLLRKARSDVEIYNDLDVEIVQLFRVLRDPEQARQLVALVELTPFAREEFDAAYEPSADPIEACRRLLARSFMGHGSTAVCTRRNSGFRAAHSNRNGRAPAIDWRNMPPALVEIVERIQGVTLENRPALSIMGRFDSPQTLFYLDPPYVHAARSSKRVRGGLQHAYKHEMDGAAHAKLLSWLQTSRSMIVLSGYADDAYEAALGSWRRRERKAMADGGLPRTEVLWINPAAARAAGDLFSGHLVAA